MMKPQMMRILITTVDTLQWAGMEAVCLSPWLTHWHSHTGIHTMAMKAIHLPWHSKRLIALQ